VNVLAAAAPPGLVMLLLLSLPPQADRRQIAAAIANLFILGFPLHE
jgi:hypothetical protein